MESPSTSYKSRPRYYADSLKKPGFTVSADLAKRRYLLLTIVKPGFFELSA